MPAQQLGFNERRLQMDDLAGLLNVPVLGVHLSLQRSSLELPQIPVTMKEIQAVRSSRIMNRQTAIAVDSGHLSHASVSTLGLSVRSRRPRADGTDDILPWLRRHLRPAGAGSAPSIVLQCRSAS